MPALKPKPDSEKSPKRRPDVDNSSTPFRTLLFWLLFGAMLLLGFQVFVRSQEEVSRIRYNPDFMQLVEGGKVRECKIVDEPGARQYILGERLDAPEGKPRKFRVDVVITDNLIDWLLANNVHFTVDRPNPYVWQMISGALPVLIILGLLYFLFMRQIRAVGSGALNFGKSRAKMLMRDRNKVTFKNVAGIDEAKEEVEEIIEFLRDPKRFQKLGGRIPKGVLLMGPPGSGKTLLAKAIAGEAEVPFFSISGSDFVEMFVGVGASRVRDMFEQGKRNAPCLIFIDEIDAVGRSRFSGIGGGHDEREQTLNALLVEMDGFDTQEGVIIIAATNRPDVLDPALQRPGRFDRQIVIDLPTIDGREAILKIHAEGISLSKDAELRQLARGTPGFTGADLANLMNEAALLAAREGKDAVGMKDLEEARDKVRWGRERRSRVLDEKEKRIAAFHETGHALVMVMVEESEPLHKITIIPRGRAYLGATMQLPEKDRYMEGRRKLVGLITALMGGRVSEELVFGDITSGAASDLKEATRIARLMVCSWGMSGEMGPQTFGEQEELLFFGREVSRSKDFSEDTARRIDAEVNKLLRECHDRARNIIESKRDKLQLIADHLLDRETLDGREVEELIRFGRILAEEERAQNAAREPSGPQPVKGKPPEASASS